MSNFFSYSVLQHHYSSFIDEVVNVGVLFFFPTERIIKFQIGNLDRLKCLYSDVDVVAIEGIAESIEYQISKEFFRQSLFTVFFNEEELHTTFLKPDDSALQFTKPKKSLYPSSDIYQIISDYCKLLLPSTKLKADEITKPRFNEQYIKNRYIGTILSRNKGLENFIRRNRVIESNGLKLEFDYGWKNNHLNSVKADHLNLVKAVSFDLKKEDHIQNKAVQYFGYLTKFKDYAETNNLRYDLLVWKPQERELQDDYFRAIDVLESANANKKIVTEEIFEEYTEDSYQGLTKELEESLI